jgi:hypothetical protein
VGDCPPIPSSQVGVPARDILRFLIAGHVSSRVASQQVGNWEIGKFLFLCAPDFRVDNPGIWHIFLECHFRSTTHVAPRRFEFGYTPAIGLPADRHRIWGYHDDPCLTMRINLVETPWETKDGRAGHTAMGQTFLRPGYPNAHQGAQGGPNFIFRGECFSPEAFVRFSRTDISFAEFPQTRQRR